MTKRNLPVSTHGTSTKNKSTALARIRAATPAKRPGAENLLAAALTPARRPRLVFAVDATASREPVWELAKKATDSLFNIVPGQLDIALAAHGGGSVHTFTSFSSDHRLFRDQAAAISCEAGPTALIALMNQVLTQPAVKVLLYIGDCFEEDPGTAFALADSFKARGIRTILMHDTATGTTEARAVFDEIARRTGGVCVDFHGANCPTDELRELLSAVAVLATGGVKLLEEKKKSLPGAMKLLPFLK